MSEIIKEEVQGYNVFDVAQNPSAFPEEIQSAAYDIIRVKMLPQLNKCKKKLEESLLIQMDKEEATEIHYIAADGEEKILKKKKGKTDCKIKDADERYKKAGFEPTDIGEYIFKPSWTKAKKARNVGGEKKKIIDLLFKEEKGGIEIK